MDKATDEATESVLSVIELKNARWNNEIRKLCILYWSGVGHATSRKVAGSIPDGVIGIFHLHNPSGRTMATESTQPLTEMSTRNSSWG